jgi:hypothetical protein
LKITFEKKETVEPLTASCEGGCDVVGIANGNLTAPQVDDAGGSIELSEVLLCKTLPGSGACQTGSTDYQDIGLNIKGISFNEGGTIVARMNQDGQVSECSKNNESYIYCGIAESKFFTVDYYAWVK